MFNPWCKPLTGESRKAYLKRIDAARDFVSYLSDTYASAIVMPKLELIKIFFQMLVLMASILSIDIEEMMEKLMQSDQTSKQLLAMLKALNEFEDNGHNNNKIVDCLPAA
jgi:hypothetical protein